MEQEPEITGETKNDLEPREEEPTGFTQKQVDETLARLEEVLKEGAEKPKIEDSPEASVNEDALYGELDGAGIELLSTDDGVEEVFTPEYVEKAKKAFDQMFPGNESGDETDNESTG